MVDGTTGSRLFAFVRLCARFVRVCGVALCWLIAPACFAAPVISGFTPTSGTIGSTVTINGTGFGTTPAANTVKFNTINATVTAATATQLTVTVPPASLTGKIKVTVAGATATSTANYVVLPTITSFSPVTAPVGASVVIQGTGYSSTISASQVRFNNNTATVTAATPTQLTATVPASATNGPIRVTVGGQSVNSATNFTVGLSVTGFTPTSGVVGSTVRIQGKAFSTTPANNLVKFNGVETEVSAATATQLTVVPPWGATTGPVSVTVAGTTATSAASFSIIPDIFNVQGDGVVGAEVRIAGQGFHPVASSNGVTFNGVAAVVTQADPGLIVTSVPAGATSGPLRVTIAGQSASQYFAIPIATAIDGPTLTGSSPAGLPLQFAFNANASESFGAAINSIVVNPPGPVYVDLDRQDWQIVQCTESCTISPVNAQSFGGRHELNITPLNSGATVQATVTLSSTLSGTLVSAQPPTSLDLQRPGRSAVLTFGAVPNEDLKLTIGSFATTGNRPLRRMLRTPPSLFEELIELAPGSASVLDLQRRTASTNYQLTLTTTHGATTPITVGLAPQPVTLTITGTTPAMTRVNDPISIGISIVPKPPATAAPTGTVNITYADGSNACTIVLPATSCDIVAVGQANYLVARYIGDANYGTAISAPGAHNFASELMAVHIVEIRNEPATTSGTWILATAEWHDVRYPPHGGTITITNGIHSCTGEVYNGANAVVWGECIFEAPPGTHALRAYYSGDDSNGGHPPGMSERVLHVVSSPGGATAVPADSEICGFDPESAYPPPSPSVPVHQLPGAVWSLGQNASINVTTPLTAEIVHPAHGSTVSDEFVDIVGTFKGPVNTGIVVNGVIAHTVGGRFLAPQVPLTTGANMLTVTLTTLTGETFTRTATINRSGPAPPLAVDVLSVNGSVALGPNTQYFAYRANLPPDVSILSVAIDFEGEGVDNDNSNSLASADAVFVYRNPGLYRMRLRAGATDGQTYEAIRYLMTEDLIAQRSMVCDVVGYLRRRLAAGDSAGAVLAFHEGERAKYGQEFSALGGALSAAAPKIGVLAGGTIGLGLADMTLVRDGAGQTRRGFPIQVARGSDGVWRVSEI